MDSKKPVEAKGLALLAGVAEHTLRNLMAGSNSRFTPLDDDRIDGVEAQIWVGRNRRFRRSTWQFDEQQAPGTVDAGRYYVVPTTEASEKTFHPLLRWDGLYRLGRGQKVEFTVGFDQAIERLQGMPNPCWEERQRNGGWSTYVGKRWIRVSGRQLMDLAVDDIARNLV